MKTNGKKNINFVNYVICGQMSLTPPCWREGVVSVPEKKKLSVKLNFIRANCVR